MSKENLNREEQDLVLDALNDYWHKANALLNMKLGDIERKNWEDIKTKAGELMRKIHHNKISGELRLCNVAKKLRM
jgi:1,2-phenylacetyl-CoA epoxidase catalytic subunit